MSFGKLTIIRGVPGTGKTTLGRAMNAGIVLAADDYFTADTGEYLFDVEKLGTAHRWCITTTKALLRAGHDVVVTNTFTRFHELKDYLVFAKKNNIEVNIITLTHEYGSIHDVPDTAMENMRNRFASHEDVMDRYRML